MTFTAITEMQARRDHKISIADHRCLAHCVTLTQHRNARDILANEEQAGNTTTYPEPSAKPTMLPTRSVPRSHAASDASISKMGFSEESKHQVAPQHGDRQGEQYQGSAPACRTVVGKHENVKAEPGHGHPAQREDRKR